MIYRERLIELAQRKERLIGTCARQRDQLAAQLSAWQAPLAVIDRGVSAARFLRSHPVAVAAAIIGAAVLGRRRLLRWAGRGVLMWRGWRTVRMLLGALSA